MGNVRGVINMKTKIRMITAFLVVLVAMTGIAGAVSISLIGGSNPQELVPGSSFTLDLKATTLPTPLPAHYDLTYTVTGVKDPVTLVLSDPSDVTVTFASGSLDANIDPYLADDEVTISLKALPHSPPGSRYVVKVFAKPKPGTIDGQASASRVIKSIEPPTNIPEFPTVALPVIAVIGLLFFFQHRKRKEG